MQLDFLGSRFTLLLTRTQTTRNLAKSGNLIANVATVPKRNPRCPLCGANVTTGSMYCVNCVPAVNRENLLKQAKLGRIATHSAIAEARRSVTQARLAQALRNWHPSDLPTWLDEDCYRREILPRLSKFTVKKRRRYAWRLMSLILTQRSSDAEYLSLTEGTG